LTGGRYWIWIECKSIAIPLALLLVLPLVPLLLLLLLVLPLLLLVLLVLLLLLLLLRTLMSAYLSPPGMTRFIQSGFLLRSCAHTTAAYVTSRSGYVVSITGTLAICSLGVSDVSRVIICCF
jgi:hypothetical protein